MPTKYGVNETFNTVQGEGILVGLPATFIRLQGCTVGCPWCDTKYTWKAGGIVIDARDLVASLDLLPHVVITGGEPTLYDLDELIVMLRYVGQAKWGHDFRVQIETSGQNDFRGEISPDYVTWSPKKNLDYDAKSGIKQVVTEVKWVVDDELTIDDVKNRMREVNRIARRHPACVLMPEGCPPSQEHVDKTWEWLMDTPTWRFSDRLQWRIGVK